MDSAWQNHRPNIASLENWLSQHRKIAARARAQQSRQRIPLFALRRGQESQHQGKALKRRDYFLGLRGALYFLPQQGHLESPGARNLPGGASHLPLIRRAPARLLGPYRPAIDPGRIRHPLQGRRPEHPDEPLRRWLCDHRAQPEGSAADPEQKLSLNVCFATI